MSVDTTLSSHWSNVTRVVTYHLYLESAGDSAYCSCYAAQTHRDYTILRRWVSSGRKPGTCWFQSRGCSFIHSCFPKRRTVFSARRRLSSFGYRAGLQGTSGEVPRWLLKQTGYGHFCCVFWESRFPYWR